MTSSTGTFAQSKSGTSSRGVTGSGLSMSPASYARTPQSPSGV